MVFPTPLCNFNLEAEGLLMTNAQKNPASSAKLEMNIWVSFIRI
jgi:hypothetical protein